MKKSKVGIVILNYLTYKDTLNCLKELNELTYNNYFVVVLDNNSPNRSSEILTNEINNNRNEYSFDIYFIKNDENHGFSKGNNIGIYKAEEMGAKFILIMNNDISLKDYNILDKMIKEIDNKSEIAMVGPRIINNDGNSNLNPYLKRPSAKKIMFRYLLFPLYYIYNRLFNSNHETSKSDNVYSIPGCFMLINLEKMKEVNFFDEELFLFGEEIILGEKFYKKDYKVKFLPEVEVKHSHSKTINKIYNSVSQLKMRLNNNFYYIKKYREDINFIERIFIKISYKVYIYIYYPILVLIKK